MKKPSWISTSVDLTSFQELNTKIKGHNLHVVCFEASCPNIGTCFNRKTATFLILGKVCTRNCAFCGIRQGTPEVPDSNEPRNIAKLVHDLNLQHVVITSVTRDDLADQGATQFIRTIKEIKKIQPKIIVEVLIPDFQGNIELLNRIIQAKPEIINHNVETVPRLYAEVRPQADFLRSLTVLKHIKSQDPEIYTKTGFMVGLGETDAEIKALMQELRDNKCDILTIGQYLRPSDAQLPIQKYYTPEEFNKFEILGKNMGFLYVTAAPLIRSSYNAVDFSKRFLYK